MIIRIFKTTIQPDLRSEFEAGFNSVSVDAVRNKRGFVSCSIGYPTKWNPNDYTMITVWESEEALSAFAGENYNQAVIPPGMEKFPTSYSVEHYHIENKCEQGGGLNALPCVSHL